MKVMSMPYSPLASQTGSNFCTPTLRSSTSRSERDEQRLRITIGIGLLVGIMTVPLAMTAIAG